MDSSVTSCDKARLGERIYWQYWTDWNGLELRKSALARLEWLEKDSVNFGSLEGHGMEEVGFSMT
jgi:hypothetical protein